MADDAPSALELRVNQSGANAARAKAAAMTAAEREDDDRSWIARAIIRVFVGVLAVGLATLVLNGLMTGDWQNVTTQVIDLIKSTVLPVVTLVLGYYFGRSGRT